MTSFIPNTIASQSEIDVQRARLAPWLWPVRVTMLVCYALSLYLTFHGVRVAVPMVAEYFYGTDWWPTSNNPFAPLGWVTIAAVYINAFVLIAFPVLLGINYVGETVFLEPCWRTTPLSAADVSEAALLADSSPAVETYRAAVAQRRGFVVGDLDLMRKLAEQDIAEAFDKKRQSIQAAAHNRLHGEAACSTIASQDV